MANEKSKEIHCRKYCSMNLELMVESYPFFLQNRVIVICTGAKYHQIDLEIGYDDAPCRQLQK